MNDETDARCTTLTRDPQRTVPPASDALSWRPPPAPAPRADGDAYRLDVAFDLSLPLPPQLEAARFRLLSRAAELRRSGLATPLTVASQRAHWTRLLHLLDAEAAGGAVGSDADILNEAKAMVLGGYREILRLADAGAGTA